MLTLVSVAVAMFKALLRTTLAVGAKATAEPTRREAIASFIFMLVYLIDKILYYGYIFRIVPQGFALNLQM